MENMLLFHMLHMLLFLLVLRFEEESRKLKNEKKKFLKLIESDERFKGARLYDASKGSFIAIAESSGYIALKTVDLPEAKIVHYNDLNGFEIREDRYSNSAKARQVALVGLLLGGIGLVIKAVSALKEKINHLSLIFNVNDFNMPSIEIKFLKKLDSLKINSYFYKKNVMQKINEINTSLSYIEKKYKTR